MYVEIKYKYQVLYKPITVCTYLSPDVEIEPGHQFIRIDRRMLGVPMVANISPQND